MITKREKTLKAKGYTFYNCAYSYDNAKITASLLRRHGMFATVLIEWNRGVPYYSVWSKPKKTA